MGPLTELLNFTNNNDIEILCVSFLCSVFFARIFSFCPWNWQQQRQQQHQWKLVHSPRFDKQHSHSLLFNETISLESTFRSLEINKHTHYAWCVCVCVWIADIGFASKIRKYSDIRWFVPIFARYPPIHPTNQPCRINKCSKCQVEGKYIFYRSENSVRKTLHWFFGTELSSTHCELWAWKIGCVWYMDVCGETSFVC